MNYWLVVEAIDVLNPLSRRAFESPSYKKPFRSTFFIFWPVLNPPPVGFFYSIIGKPEHD